MFDRKDFLVFKESARPPLNEEGYYRGNMGADPVTNDWTPENHDGTMHYDDAESAMRAYQQYEQAWRREKSMRDEGSPTISDEDYQRLKDDLDDVGRAGVRYLAEEQGLGVMEAFDAWRNMKDAGLALSYDHNTWMGYLNSKNERPENDDFTKRLKDISRG